MVIALLQKHGVFSFNGFHLDIAFRTVTRDFIKGLYIFTYMGLFRMI